MSEPKRLVISDLDDAQGEKWKSSLIQVVSSIEDYLAALGGVVPYLVSKQVFIPDEWVNLTLRAGFQVYVDAVPGTIKFEPPRIRKTDDGQIECAGILYDPAGHAAMSVVAQVGETALPARYTAASLLPERYHISVGECMAGHARVDYSEAGELLLWTPALAATDYLSWCFRCQAADRSSPQRLDSPIFIDYDFGGKRCVDVRCIDAVNVSTQATPVPEPRLSWVDLGGRISIKNILGLPSNQKYNLMFQLTPEP